MSLVFSLPHINRKMQMCPMEPFTISALCFSSRLRLELLPHQMRTLLSPQWKMFVWPTAQSLRFTSQTSGTEAHSLNSLQTCFGNLLTSASCCVCSCLCSMEEGAADKCRESIERALQYHSDSPEALQLMASYLFSTERNQVSTHTLTDTHTLTGWVITTLKQESAELIILSKLNCMPLISRWTHALTLRRTQTGHAGRNVNYLAYHLGHTFIWQPTGEMSCCWWAIILNMEYQYVAIRTLLCASNNRFWKSQYFINCVN